MAKLILKNERRTYKQIREHYILEKALANKLRIAEKSERRFLYTQLYDELFQKVPHLIQCENIGAQQRSFYRQMRLLKRYLKPEITFMEIGPGNCKLSFEVSKLVTKVYAIEVSPESIISKVYPRNFCLIFSNGSSIPVEENSINVAYSHQLMEHLHPEDALEQLENIYKALIKGGIYLCITPNKLTGPHDISKYFDKEATGLHLKEYTINELFDTFKSVGFSKVFTLFSLKGYNIPFPVSKAIWLESLLINHDKLSLLKRNGLFYSIIKSILGINLVAVK